MKQTCDAALAGTGRRACSEQGEEITFPGMKPSLPPWPSFPGFLAALTETCSREGCRSSSRETCGSSARPAHSTREHSPSGEGHSPVYRRKHGAGRQEASTVGPALVLSLGAGSHLTSSIPPQLLGGVGYQTPHHSACQLLTMSHLDLPLDSTCHKVHKEPKASGEGEAPPQVRQ